MGRNVKVQDREQVNIWLPTAQLREIEKIRNLTGQSKTDVFIEAIQYWLNAQRKMVGAGVNNGL